MTYNYKFDNTTNLVDDECHITETNIQNNHFANYRTTNFQPCNNNAMKFALQQPNVFIKGSVGYNGCDTDNDSKLQVFPNTVASEVTQTNDPAENSAAGGWSAIRDVSRPSKPAIWEIRSTSSWETTPFSLALASRIPKYSS